MLTPVGYQDIADLIALKGDPGVYAQMLGGVCDPVRVAQELADETRFWAQHGVGMWLVRDEGRAIGLTGLHERRDGRGVALRFAFQPASRGKGLAREAAGAALRFAHERAGVPRVIAVANVNNFSSRTVLGAIGMRVADAFDRNGDKMLVYESTAPSPPGRGSG